MAKTIEQILEGNQELSLFINGMKNMCKQIKSEANELMNCGNSHEIGEGSAKDGVRIEIQDYIKKFNRELKKTHNKK